MHSLPTVLRGRLQFHVALLAAFLLPSKVSSLRSSFDLAGLSVESVESAETALVTDHDVSGRAANVSMLLLEIGIDRVAVGRAADDSDLWLNLLEELPGERNTTSVEAGAQSVAATATASRPVVASLVVNTSSIHNNSVYVPEHVVIVEDTELCKKEETMHGCGRNGSSRCRCSWYQGCFPSKVGAEDGKDVGICSWAVWVQVAISVSVFAFMLNGVLLLRLYLQLKQNAADLAELEAEDENKNKRKSTRTEGETIDLTGPGFTRLV